MLPGNAVTRAIGGMPAPPSVGAIEFDAIAAAGRSIAIEPITLVAGPDLVLAPPESDEHGIDLEVSSLAIETEFPPVAGEEVDLQRFTPPTTDGALFFAGKKLGSPASRANVTDFRPSEPRKERAENLLSALLPILLPPASADFAQVFVLPHDLYAFQEEGIKFLTEEADGRLLADDMGLGKTVQAIVAMRHMFRMGLVTRALVVSPKSVQTSWLRHLAEWAPELIVQPIAGPSGLREAQWAALNQYKAHVGVVTYATFRSDSDRELVGTVDLVVCDELQNIKNRASKQSASLRALVTKRRWGLTGTPLENRLEEFVSILHFLDPNAISLMEYREAVVREAASRLMLRRRKDVIQDQLPAITRNIEYIELNDAQRDAYDLAETEGVARLRGRDVTVTHVLALISALKQICNGVDGDSAKTDWLTEYADITSTEGDKSLVFSQYVASLSDLEVALAEHRPLTYRGDMSTAQRDRELESFIDEPSHQMMLISLRAGGTGLDRLQYAANRVVHFDSWWNPAVMDQATGRVFRIGQVKGVFETTLVAADTVEERIQQILEDKRELFSRVVDDLSVQGLARALTEEELFGLFGLKRPARGATADARPPITPQAEPGRATGEVARPQAVISSKTPFSNVMAVRRLLRAAKGTLWWFDPNFSRRALEDLAVELDPRFVSSIRILSRELSPKDWADFRRFRAESSTAGMTAEWKVLPGRVFHDRFIADDEMCFNVPPVNLIYDSAAPYSEIREAVQRPPLEDWWANGEVPNFGSG